MAEDETKPHLYGMPDPNPEPPAAEGLRGENATPLADPPSEQAHSEIAAGGQPITVVETSGTAFVEAVGKTGFDKSRPPTRLSQRDGGTRRRRLGLF